MADELTPSSPTPMDPQDTVNVPAAASLRAAAGGDVGSPEDRAGRQADKPVPPRGTSVHLLISGLIGLGISLLFFGLLRVAFAQESWLYNLFWGSEEVRAGWAVPFAATLLFFWAMAILCLKIRHIRREYRAFDLDLLPRDPYQLIGIRDVQAILREINRMPPDQQNLLLVTRIARALRRVRASGNSAEIDGLLEYQASIDSAAAESTYAAVKIFIWAIPVVGFIGTVLGISMAIGGFGDLVRDTSDVEGIKAGLGGVTGNLGLAFGTTLVALIFSILVMFFSTYIRKREDDLLTGVEDHCVEHLVNKLAIGDDKLVAQLQEAFSEVQDETIRRQAEAVEGALVELQKRQTEAIDKLNELVCQQQSQASEQLVAALRELFEDATGQQASRLSEMSQRLERGLRSLGDHLQGAGAARSDGAAAAPLGGSEPDAEETRPLVAAMQQQTRQLQDMRASMEGLSRSLQHLATLEPFQEVMGNIQKALDTLIPVVEELHRPRELRISDALNSSDAE